MILVLTFFLKSKQNLIRKSFILSILVFVYSLIPDPLGLYDRLPLSTLKVNKIIPVCVVRDIKVTLPEGHKMPQEWGMYLVCEVVNGEKDSYIESINIFGDLPLDLSFYIPLDFNIGRSIEEIEQEFEEKQPFYRIRWLAWPTSLPSAYHLSPREPGLLVFTLWNPIIYGDREAGWFCPYEDYIGYSYPRKEPVRQCGYPSAHQFLTLQIGHNIKGLNPDLFTENISWTIRVNGESEQLSHKTIDDIVIVTYKEWENEPLRKILERGDERISQ